MVLMVLPGLAGAGCFQRVYDAAHLAAHPAQGVAAIRVRTTESDRADFRAVLWVRMADQGQARRDGVAGRELGQDLLCEDGGAEAICTAPCDGDGFIDMHVDAAGRMRLGSMGLRLTDGSARCADPTGTTDLAERSGRRTVYLLQEVAETDCADMPGG